LSLPSWPGDDVRTPLGQPTTNSIAAVGRRRGRVKAAGGLQRGGGLPSHPPLPETAVPPRAGTAQENRHIINIQLDGIEAATRRIADMRAKIATLKREDIPTEFREWQTQDMGREHSSGRFGRRKVTRIIGRWSTRPILRPELLDRLQVRMAALLRDKLKW
jgi:hypothetical protein